MVIDHVGLPVSDQARSERFYQALLTPLGIRRQRDSGGWSGFGRDGDKVPEFWIKRGEEFRPLHLAFLAQSREQVRQFHGAALALGAVSVFAPRLCDIYHPDFYAAMILDPDGHSIEAVCHGAGA